MKTLWTPVDFEPPSLTSPPFFSPLRTVSSLAMKGYFRLQASGSEYVPGAGAAILAPNHTSFLDPVLLQMVIRRRIVFLVTSEFYDLARFRRFMRWTGAIRVDTQRPNREAFRQARACLRAGHLVGIFPEGKISRQGDLGPLAPGFASLMLRENVPVIPVGIQGAFEAMARHQRFPRPRKIRVQFGAPLHEVGGEGLDITGSDPPEVRREKLSRLSATLMTSIRHLLER